MPIINTADAIYYGSVPAVRAYAGLEQVWPPVVSEEVAYRSGLYLPGVSDEYISTPDHTDLDITGDLCVVAHLAADDWTPAANATILAKWSASSASKSYLMNLAATTGRPRLYWTTDGSTTIYREATIAPTISDGEALWVAASLDVDNGASGHDVTFWTSADGVSWSQLGTTVTTGGTTSVKAGSRGAEIGTHSSGSSSPLAAVFYRCTIYDGIGDNTAPGQGTLVAEADFTRPWPGGRYYDDTDKIWTINGSASAWETEVV